MCTCRCAYLWCLMACEEGEIPEEGEIEEDRLHVEYAHHSQRDGTGGAKSPLPSRIAISETPPTRMTSGDRIRGPKSRKSKKRKKDDSAPLKNRDHIDYNSIKKTSLCKTFSETGGCKNGDHCGFAHGKHELRPWVSHTKTKMCRNIEMGMPCPFGRRCRHAHSATELTKVQSGGVGGHQEEAIAPSLKNEDKLLNYTKGKRSYTLDAKSSSTNTGFERLLALCDNGEVDDEAGEGGGRRIPDVETSGGEVGNKKKVKVKSERRREKDAAYAARLKKEKEQAELRAALPPPPCVFFSRRGGCRSGTSCPFSHDPSLINDNGDGERRPQSQHHDMCKFFLAGRCKKGTSCGFSHDRSSEPCAFFHFTPSALASATAAAAGICGTSVTPAFDPTIIKRAETGRGCRRGDACNFSHESLSPNRLLAFYDRRSELERRLKQQSPTASVDQSPPTQHGTTPLCPQPAAVVMDMPLQQQRKQGQFDKLEQKGQELELEPGREQARGSSDSISFSGFRTSHTSSSAHFFSVSYPPRASSPSPFLGGFSILRPGEEERGSMSIASFLSSSSSSAPSSVPDPLFHSGVAGGARATGGFGSKLSFISRGRL